MTLYADDFYYGTFLQSGLEHFWQMTVEHYQSMNGRALVHFIDEVVLLFGTGLYRILCPLSIVFLGYAAGRTFYPEKEDRQVRCYYILTVLILILGMNIYLTRETLFWISGYFNYFFPVLTGILAFFLQIRFAQKAKFRWLFLPLFIVFGATTEQGGAAAFLFTALYALYHAKTGSETRKEKLFCLIPAVCVALGYATVVFAPGTMERASSDGGLISLLLSGNWLPNFQIISELVLGREGFGWYLSLFFVLAGLLPLFDKSLPKLLYSGFGVAAVILFCQMAYPKEQIPYSILMLCAVAYLAVCIITFFRSERYCNVSFYLLAMLGTLAIMLFVPGPVLRTVFPAALLLICSIAAVGMRLAENYIETRSCFWSFTVLTVLGLLAFAPTLQGYYHNNQVIRESLTSISQYDTNGWAEVNVDVQYPYAYTMLYEDGFFQKYAYEYYGLPEKAQVFYVSEKERPIYFEKHRVTYPSLLRDGAYYFPLVPLVEAAGGSAKWSAGQTELEWKGNHFIFYNQEKLLFGGNINGELELAPYCVVEYGKVYIRADKLCEAFGWQLSEKTENGGLLVEQKE